MDLEQMAREYIDSHLYGTNKRRDLVALLQRVRDETNIEWTHHRWTDEIRQKAREARDEEWEKAVWAADGDIDTKEEILRRMGRKP